MLACGSFCLQSSGLLQLLRILCRSHFASYTLWGRCSPYLHTLEFSFHGLGSFPGPPLLPRMSSFHRRIPCVVRVSGLWQTPNLTCSPSCVLQRRLPSSTPLHCAHSAFFSSMACSPETLSVFRLWSCLFRRLSEP